MRDQERAIAAACGARRAAVPVLMLIVLLGGCGREPVYDISSPEATIDSAGRMVRSGDPGRLVTLIEAEDERMEALLARLGLALAALDRLAAACAGAFPEEVEALRADAERAAAEGRSPTLVELLGRAGGFGRGSRGGDPDAGPRRVFTDLARRAFADPYGWLADESGRLNTAYIADDRVALTFDGEPLLPPFGLLLREGDDGGWRLVPPTSYAFVRRVMPRTDDEYAVAASALQALERLADDLAADVAAGRVRSLTDLSEEAVERAALPMVLIFAAYQNLLEAREDDRREDDARPTTGSP